MRNDSDEPVRVLMWSTIVLPTATVYPDSDKVGVWTGGDRATISSSTLERGRLLARRALTVAVRVRST